MTRRMVRMLEILVPDPGLHSMHTPSKDLLGLWKPLNLESKLPSPKP